MNDWSGKRVAAELQLQSGERLASIWGVLHTAGAYEFGAEAEGVLHFRVGDGEFSIDPRIVTGVAAPAGASGALVVRLHDNIQLTISGPDAFAQHPQKPAGSCGNAAMRREPKHGTCSVSWQASHPRVPIRRLHGHCRA